MAKSQKPFVGGIFIMLGLLFGAVVGIVLGQPSAGVVVGLVVGCLAAAAKSFWDKQGPLGPIF